MSAPMSLITVETDGPVARVAVNRPAANNALNPAVIYQLHQAFLQLIARPEVCGIVLSGEGKAFGAGVDVNFFIRNLEAGQIDRIVQFTKAGQDLVNEIDRCPKPVVACVHGMALGGGLEVALACDRIFISPRASLALPETRLGLYPGAGGTQRTPRKVGRGLAKWIIYTGRTLSPREALGAGLVDQILPEENLYPAACDAIRNGLPPVAAPQHTPDLAALETFFQTHTLDELLQGNVEGPRPCMGAVRSMRENGPVALRLAEWLIDEGLKRSLADGMQLELDRLTELFSTHDAREGLAALGKRKPAFEGR